MLGDIAIQAVESTEQLDTMQLMLSLTIMD
jgi:hypothetical protein